MSRAQSALIKLWAGALGMMATNAFAAERGHPQDHPREPWRSTDRTARVRAHASLVRAVLDELA